MPPERKLSCDDVSECRPVLNAPVLVRAYGEFWNRDLVDWKGSSELLGVDSKGRAINAYEQRGIYVLYDDYVPVYVGKADKTTIGHRLKLHTESRRKGSRWDRFSWFGLKRINKGGHLGRLTPTAHVKSSELISTLEALLILVVDPRLNARKESLKNAIKVRQSEKGKPDSVGEQQLASIEQKLDSLLNLSAKRLSQDPKVSRGAK